MMEEPMMDEPEARDMLPDEEMEDEYLDFILDEALDKKKKIF